MTSNFTSEYVLINGMNMYYEMYGEGNPLVLIHGGGSTIDTTFGRIIPYLKLQHRIIAVELQAHGHTGDRMTELSFEQDADDVASLLQHLHIQKASFLGFSNGGQTAIEIALRHPGLIHKLILASTFYKRSAAPSQFWEGFENAQLEMMPHQLKEGYLTANNSEQGLLNMFMKDVQRMKNFKDWTDEQIRSIQSSTLVINGTHDVGSPEHAVEMFRTIPNCELAILPGGHGDYLGCIETLPEGMWTKKAVVELIQNFLTGK